MFHWDDDGGNNIDNEAITSNCDRDEWTFAGILYDVWDDINYGANSHHVGFDQISDTIEGLKSVPDSQKLVETFHNNYISSYNRAGEVWQVFFNHNVNYDTTPPTTPALIYPSGTIGDTTPTFNWTESTDDLTGIDHYQIQVDDDSNFGGSPEINKTISSTSYPAPSGKLSSGTTYHWRVRARDTAGNWGDFQAVPYEFTIDIKPDLTLSSSDISFSPSSPNDGDDVVITATIHNIGGTSASNVKVRFSNGATQIGTDQTITSISPGGNRNAQVTWNNVPQGSYNIYVYVDPEYDIPEADESNNDASKTLTVGTVSGNYDLNFVEDQERNGGHNRWV